MVLSWLQMAGFALIILTAGCGVQAPSTSENKQGQSVATFLRPICMSDDGRLLAIADNGGAIKIMDWPGPRGVLFIFSHTNTKKAAQPIARVKNGGLCPSTWSVT